MAEACDFLTSNDILFVNAGDVTFMVTITLMENYRPKRTFVGLILSRCFIFNQFSENVPFTAVRILFYMYIMYYLLLCAISPTSPALHWRKL